MIRLPDVEKAVYAELAVDGPLTVKQLRIRLGRRESLIWHALKALMSDGAVLLLLDGSYITTE